MSRSQYSRGIAVAVACASLFGCSRGETDIRVSLATGTPTGALVLDLARRPDTAVSRVDRSRYDFRQANKSEFLLEGWARPETSEDGDLSFAWATSRRASVRLAVFDADYRWLHFRSRASAHALAGGQTAGVTVNGHAVGNVDITSGGFRHYSLLVAGEALTPGDNVVSFSFASAEAPTEVSLTTRDTRTLAAAFDYIALTDSREVPPSLDRRQRLVGFRPDDGRIRQHTGTESAFRVRVPEEGSLEFAGEEIELVFRIQGGADYEDTAEWVQPQLYGNVDVTTNVLLIVIDTLRADHLGSYGGESHTPNLDALAGSGVRFENAYSQIPITLPSHSSMFTSLLPTEHAITARF